MIRTIATDIDGTFLTTDRHYDQHLFNRLYKQMAQKGIRFIVASGDQYYFLRSLFPDVADQLAFVAENGVLTVDRNQGIACGQLKPADVTRVIAYLETLPRTSYIVCGRQSAYVKDSMPDHFIQNMDKFYTRTKVVHEFDFTGDKIFKFALTVPAEKMRAIAHDINIRFAGIIRATASGNGAIDLIIPHMDKSYGLKKLLNRWQVDPVDLVVFGDGENDLEMFDLAGTSYAMENAPANVKAAATQTIGTNNDQSVLQQMRKLLK